MCYLRFMEQQAWYSTKEVAEILGVTITRANQLMHKAYRNNPATQDIRKVPSVKGGKRLEMSRSLLEQEKRLREFNAEARPFVKPADAVNVAARIERLENEKKALQDLVGALQERYEQAQANPESRPKVYPLGAHEQEDGTYIYVYTPEEWFMLWEQLQNYQSLKERAAEWVKQLEELRGAQEKELARLEQAYEENIKTYQEQTQYLRQRLESADTLLLNQQQAVIESLKAMRERNYIEARNEQ